jgi:hypothetical protein
MGDPLRYVQISVILDVVLEEGLLSTYLELH